MAPGQRDEVLPGEVLGADGVAPRQRVPRGQQADGRRGDQGLAADAVVDGLGVGEADVEAAFRDAGHQRVAGQHVEDDLHVRVNLAKRRDVRRQEPVRDRRRRHDAEGAVVRLPRRVRPAGDAVERVEHRLQLLVDRQRVDGRDQSPACPIEQRHAQTLFELCQAPADRGLRDAQVARRVHGGAPFDKPLQHFEFAQGDPGSAVLIGHDARLPRPALCISCIWICR